MAISGLLAGAARMGAKKIAKKLAEKEAPIVVGGAGASGGSYISAAKSAEEREQESRESAAEKKRETRGMKEGKSVPAADDDEGGRTKFIRENMKEGKMKDVFMGVSKAADKVGIRQDEAYKGKSKEEVMRKAKGGMVKSSASKRADGCAQRGKTKGRMV